MSVVEAVERDLQGMPIRVRESALAATAMALAMDVDDRQNSATSRSMCSRVLADILEQLRELAPPIQEKDGVDDIAAARERRRAAAS